jgi:CRP-like cAMP-binding protein
MAKSSSASGPYRNAILAAMSPSLVEALRLETVDLPVNKVLYEPNQPIDSVYFPESGALSVVSLMHDGDSIEVGTIGREGMAGSVLLLQTATVPYRYFMQIAGEGYQMSADRFIRIAGATPELRNAILKYEAGFRVQTQQGMACNGLHNVEQRCCRWLLMTRDRVESDDLKLTHEFLGLMLGVRRASVTDVLSPLQADGLVSSNRGTITILNRKGLEKRVCECYGIMVQQERER